MIVRVGLPRSLQERMCADLASAGLREIGGVLMARQIEPGQFEIIDFSIDELTGERAHFVRDHAFHNKALDDFFERTGCDYGNYNYLGEWHSHPELPVCPSITDLRSMENLVNGERAIPFAVLLIVRSDSPYELRVTATFHQRGVWPQPVDLNLDC
ncbi:Mov34/MPN/PAD-1 family protein [Ensifer sp. IC3342]|nr:Mov34/MPN/PAD-1 family protein [Ensifer sp. BRP08]MCA1450406.1 Mov34/MPN/PAD-1 family protein [Ensifer sp. IC3342]